MKRFTPEKKLDIVQRYINEPVSYRDLEKDIGIDNSTLRYWVKLYQYHGNQAFHHPYTKYSPAFKLEVVQFIEETDYSIREASAIFHIPDFSIVRRWMEKWRKGGALALENQGKGTFTMANKKKKKTQKKPSPSLDAETKDELEYLRAENAYLKKLWALVQEENESPKNKKRK